MWPIAEVFPLSEGRPSPAGSALIRYLLWCLGVVIGSFLFGVSVAQAGNYADLHEQTWGVWTLVVDGIAIPVFSICVIALLGGLIGLVHVARLAIFARNRTFRPATLVVGLSPDGATWKQPRIQVDGVPDFLVLSARSFLGKFRGCEPNVMFTRDDRRGVVVTRDGRRIGFASRNPIHGRMARSAGLV